MAAVIAFASLLMPGWSGGRPLVLAMLSTAALTCGLVLRRVRQVPYKVALALTASGILTIAAAQYAAGTGGAAAYAALYSLALAAAFFFYTPRLVVAQIILAAATQYSVLYLTGAGRTTRATVVLTVGSACASGVVVRRLATLRARAEQKLAWQAAHDSLTGLPNRLDLARRGQLALAENHEVSILLLDMRGFKKINDEKGHHYGDAALVEVARRLATLGGRAEAARLGGDEFVVLLPGVGIQEAQAWGLVVAETLHGTCRVGDVDLVLEATVGVATHRTADAVGSRTAPAEALSALLAAADAAMYRARQLGQRVASAHEVYADPLARPSEHRAETHIQGSGARGRASGPDGAPMASGVRSRLIDAARPATGG